MIRKKGKFWVILSQKGKVLGSFESRAAALKRLREIEYFKHKK